MESFENINEETNTYISVERLREILMSKGEPFTEEEMNQFLQVADPEKTGWVLYKEFIRKVMS